jgi:hypothetical protein
VSKKMKNPVPSVEVLKENTVEPEREPVPVPEQPIAPAAVSATPEPKPEAPKALSIIDIAKGIDQAKVDLAEKMGIPITALLKYMYQQELAQKEIISFLTKQGASVQVAPVASPSAPSGSSGMGSLLSMAPDLIKQFLGTGSGNTTLGDELTRKVIDAGLEQMTMGTQLLKTIQSKMMSELGSKAVAEVIGKA